jgi:hypothetical protein
MKTILGLLLTTTCATADVCRVSDSAPPLNIRIYPNGKIVGSLPNAQLASGAASNDLEDITHGCVQCGAMLDSTRPFSDDTDATTHPNT